MRRLVLWFASTVTLLVLLMGYRTSTMGIATVVADSRYTAGTSQVSGTGPGTGTFTGSTVHTQYGPVQVEVTLDQGTVIGARVLQHPTGNSRDEEINSRALPILIDETMKAGNAHGLSVHMVSGATYTSTGYQQSLQAALDQAGV